jgi:hypothetical protein
MLNGFLLEFPTRQIQGLPVAGGWKKVLSQFNSNEVAGMERYPERLMVLLMDFDGRSERLAEAKAVIPSCLLDRMFVLGVWTEPEKLKAGLGSFETIGRALARDREQGTDAIWGHNLLRHNAAELARLCEHFGPMPLCR